jgi:hypothetical protein
MARDNVWRALEVGSENLTLERASDLIDILR